MINYKKWLLYIIINILSLFFIITLIQLVTDPNGIWSIINVDGFNKYKNHVLSDRMTKLYCIKRCKPTNLMLGTSRIEALDPKYLEKYIQGQTYNLGLIGANAYEQYRYLQYVVSNYDIKNVIWGIDFFSFNPEREPSLGFEEKRLENTYYFKDYFDSILSFTVLKNSFLTLRDNVLRRKIVSYDYTIGSFIDLSPELRAKNISYIKKQIALSLKSYASEKHFFNNLEFKNPSSISQNVKYMQEVFNICKSRNICLKVYICPIYSAHFDLIYKMGLGNTFEQWKRNIIQLADFYDFTGHNSITDDLKYYQDSSHILTEYAGLIFARIYNDKAVKVPSDFGILVTKTNIEKHLNDLREQVKDIDLEAIKKITFSSKDP
ncbi:MAG: hypothetical protein QG641_1552 [Candidatus Poribacteria bacterium]|nr:hypothetical protein [Candidatus Poribacteria bacterium]